MKTLISVVAGATMLTVGCATVPDDAPQELHSAKSSIDAAKEADADDFVPKTIDAAEDKLDNAVSLFKDSKDEDTENPAGKLDDSKKEAVTAKAMADNALALTADVKGWDGTDLSAWAALKNPPASPEQPIVTNTPQELPELTKTVAFFETNQADVDQALAPELDTLVQLLKQNDGIYVSLIGYADRRGSADHNEELSASRAENVAAYLRRQGIAEARIKVEAKGATAATAPAGNEAHLQLDRRVDAELGNVAH